MANEHLFRFHRGGASSYEASQGDPDASLGGFQASETVANFEGAVTGTVSDRSFVDSSLGAESFVGGWVVFLDTNLNEVREIKAHDTGTDTLTFAGEVLPSSPVVTDRYWIFMPGSCFSSYDGDLCRRRAVRHRLVYMKNEIAAERDSCRLYVIDVQAGPLVCEVACGARNYPLLSNLNLIAIADEEAAPKLFEGFGLTNETQQWQRPRNYAGAQQSPSGTEGVTAQKTLRDIASTRSERAFWIRLSLDVDSPIPLPSVAVFQIYFDSDDGLTVSSMLVVVDIDGVPEVITPVIDRRLRIAGGARLSCIVLDSVAPFEPVPGRTFLIELASGPGSMNAQSETVQEATLPPADAEAIRRVYVCPTDPVEVGNSVTFDFEVT